jgi:methyl-accepting chemotaxis protein
VKASKITFQSKIVVGVLATVAVVIAALTVINLVQVKDSLRSLGRTSLASFADSVTAMMDMQSQLLRDKAQGDLNLMLKAINSKGFPTLNRMETVEMQVAHQETGETQTVTIPPIDIGSTKLFKNTEFMDEIEANIGSIAHVYVFLPDMMVRIATSVETEDGTRPVGLYLPSDHPAYQAMENGETYLDILSEGGGWYQTAYMPLTDFGGKTIGVVSVGRPVITPEFEKTISALSMGGKGASLIFSLVDGKILYHPELAGQSLTEYPFWEEFRVSNKDYATFNLDGEEQVAYLEQFEPWQMTYAFTIPVADMSHGLESKLAGSGAIVAVAAILLTAAIVFLLIKTVSRPLRDLSAFTEQVSQGDYDAHISYQANDAIGRTIAGVRTMVDDLKGKLAFSEGVLGGFTLPAVIVNKDHSVAWTNTQMLELLGVDGKPEDYVGLTSGELYWGDPSRKSVADRAVDENRIIHDEQNYTTRAGDMRVIDVTSTPFQDMDGEMLGSLSVWYDLTDIRSQQRLIEEQNDAISMTAAQADTISQELASAAAILNREIADSLQGTEIQFERANETALAMNEMNASVQGVAENAGDASQKADETRQLAQSGADRVVEMVQVIRRLENHSENLKQSNADLADQTESIGRILQVINDIADQTNLLALNAAIEAARAGDAGRGFAVVADEVRKLAEKTMTATKEVAEAITSVQHATDKNTSAADVAVETVSESAALADESLTALNQIVGMTEQTAERIQAIAAAAEEQTAASEVVNDHTSEIRSISEQTSQAMTESSQAVENLANLATQLKDLIHNMSMRAN